ncbi:MAG: MAPEG family protein [Alphaproteobacteria bacterium]|nr:MAPEG family protein [Alphaproteobacteria bacterium]
MTFELYAALLVLALGVLQVILQAGEFRRVHGVAYANTAQDTAPTQPDSVLLGRLTRALRNLHETLPFFLGVVIILAIAGVSTPTTRWAAAIFVLARIVYLPLYALGVPYLRGLVWTISFGALIALIGAALAAFDPVTMLSILG